MKEVVCLADNLRITAPVTPNESVSRPVQTAEPPQVLPTDPNRVPGNGNQTENPGAETGELLLNRGSVFGQFIEQLRAAPGLSATLQGMLLNAVARQGSISARLPADSPLRSLLASIRMEPEQAAESLAFQQENATQFGGPLFRLLGQISEQSENSGFDLRTADFLKAFSGYFSRESTTLSILANLKQIRDTIPLPYGKKLQEAMRGIGPESAGRQTEDGADAGEQTLKTPDAAQQASARTAGGGYSDRRTEENLNALKQEIIPFLKQYVSQTNDYGKARDSISMLLHNTAILNVSTRGNLEQRFDQLFRYCKYNLGLPDATMDLMRSLFGEEIALQRSGHSDAFSSALVRLLSSASGGGTAAGTDRSALQDITRSILLDSSVYMPFQHLFLPVDIGGRFLFAQMWIEKKDEDADAPRGRGSADSRPASVLLTFDIQDLGYFEAAVKIRDRHVDLSLNYPPALDRYRGSIRAELSSILEKNGLNAESVQVSPCAAPRVPEIIREAVEKRRHSVNVSV